MRTWILIFTLIFFALASTRAEAGSVPPTDIPTECLATCANDWEQPAPIYKHHDTYSKTYSSQPEPASFWGTCQYYAATGEIYIVSGGYTYWWKDTYSYRTDNACVPKPCDYPNMTRDANGVCQCDTGYIPDNLEGGCQVEPDCAEKPDSSWSIAESTCVCKPDFVQSVFTDTCLPDGSDPDTDGDGIPDSSDPDIDGDGIPNESDPDIDGDGIPNGSDLTPNGGGGGGGSDTPEIQDQCLLTDINSHTSGSSCVCNPNYHMGVSGYCEVDSEPTHDTSCDYASTKNGYPFQRLTSSTFMCQSDINFWNGGAWDKIASCDYYGCYYSKDGTSDGNGTTPNDTDGDGIPDTTDPDIDGDGIPDGNGTDGISDGGLFDKAKGALSSLKGKDINLNVSAGSGTPINVTIMGQTYNIFDPKMIDNAVWQSIALIMKWVAIIAGIITIFTTI